jgi:hypothetical protein
MKMKKLNTRTFGDLSFRGEMSVEEFKEEFEISNLEWDEALKFSAGNEFGTVDISFDCMVVDDDGDEFDGIITVEIDGEIIKHIYDR